MTDLEQVLINSYKAGMIEYVESHPEDFDELVKLSIEDKQPFSWRAAWLLWSCMTKNDQRVFHYIDSMIKTLPTKRDGHQRELVKILSDMELNEDQEGQVFDICVSLWEKIGKKPSIRYTAFKEILKIAQKYPELANEISFLTQEHFTETLSPGVRKSINRMIADFKKS